MDVWEAIRNKRAVREFTDEPLPQATIERILDAGRLAQSSKNTQPWHFITITEREMLAKVAETGDYLSHVTGAALCVVIAMPADDPRGWKMFDVGQCAAYMQLVAQELGVGSVLGAIYRYEDARKVLGLPDELVAHALISFGYPHANFKGWALGKEGRRPLDEVVHQEGW